MSDFFSALLARAGEIGHLSGFTGIAIGLLAALAALAYLEPLLRSIIIKLAIVVVLIYVAGITGYAFGAHDVHEQWAKADARATAQAQARDAQIATVLEAKYGAKIAALEQHIAVAQQRINAYDQHKGRTICPLGADALRLRRQ